jgi:hypothetical protein
MDFNLEKEKIPETYMIKDVKHFFYKESYCESTAFQMVLYKNGYKPTIKQINFLMGFTYGAFYPGSQYGFIPYNDPVMGTKVAASHFKLKQKYYITNSDKLFINTLKYYLSRDYPICIQLNEALLIDKQGVFPHCELFVGYDKKGFYYYQTSNKYNKHEKPLFIDYYKLLKAVKQLNEFFSRNWKYAFYIFEKDNSEVEPNYLQRNGYLLKGFKQKNLATGFLAIKEFAKDIENQEKIQNPWAFEALFYTRLHNAEYIAETFDIQSVKNTSEIFMEASNCYKQAFNIYKEQNENNLTKIIKLLNKGADLENNIANIFINNA